MAEGSRGGGRWLHSGAADRCWLCHKRLGQDLSYILNRKAILGLNCFDAILKHGDTEWTGGGHRLSSGIQSLLYSCIVDTLADLFFHPDSAAASTAAEGPVTTPAHFSHTIAVDSTDDLARRIVDIVPPSKKARIMVSQSPLVEACGHL